MVKLREFLEVGLKGLKRSLSAQGISLKQVFQEYAQGEERTLVLRVRSPRGRAEEFGFYIDTRSWDINVTDSYAISEPTVRVTVLDDDLMWALAAGHQSLFSAYYMELPIQMEGPYVLRDALILDKILELIRTCLLADGIDLKARLAPQ